MIPPCWSAAMPCTNVTVLSATKIICTAPAHAAGAVDVAISTGGDTIRLADAFTYAIAGITLLGPTLDR